MITPRVLCYISTINLCISILGCLKEENYWYLPPIIFCLLVCIVYSVIEYRRHKEKMK